MRSYLYGLGAVGLALALPGQAAALDEVNTYGIGSFGGTNQCGKMGDSHSVHPATANAFSLPFTILKGAGQWDTVNNFTNGQVNALHFTDAGKNASGLDLSSPKGSDTPDVLYVHTHGSHDASGSSIMMSDNSQGCWPSTNGNMRYGNGSGDLDIAVVKACQSGDYDVWKTGAYRTQLTSSTGSFTMWNAFHGDSSCGNHVTSYVLFYSLLSLKEGAGENWIDAAYDDDGDPDEDDCPVSVVFGATKAARASMYEHGGWRDRKNTGTKSASTIWYIGGCDPSSGSKLPNG